MHAAVIFENIPLRITQLHLYRMFGDCGMLKHVSIKRYHHVDSKAILARFRDSYTAEMAAMAIDGTSIYGNEITCTIFIPTTMEELEEKFRNFSQ